MEGFITVQERELYRALEKLLHNSVDGSGYPKKATIKQLKRAIKALDNYVEYERKQRAKGNKKCH